MLHWIGIGRTGRDGLTNTIPRCWSRLGLRSRLALALGIVILFGAVAEVHLAVRKAAGAARAQLTEQSQELLPLLGPLIVEHAVIGDYATIRQMLRAQVERRVHVDRMVWVDMRGRAVDVSGNDAKLNAPPWFVSYAGIEPSTATTRLNLGGVDYGELMVSFTPVAAVNTLWAEFLHQLSARGAGIVVMLLVIGFMMRGSLAVVDNIARATQRFAGGDHDVRIQGTGAPEVRAAAEAFNEMATRIGDLVATLSTSRHEMREQLHFTEELIDALPTPVYFKNRDGHYIGVNKAWEKLVGISRADFLGKTVSVLFADEPEIAALHHAKDEELWQHPGMLSYEVAATRADGRLHRLLYYKATFTNADGEIAGLIGAVVDLTEHKQAEDALRRSEANLAEAQRIAHLGSWEWDIATNSLTWSDEVYRIFGRTPDEFGNTFDAFLDAVHRDDREIVLCAVDRALSKHEGFTIEHRVVQLDGTERVVHDRGEVVVGATGQPARIVGTVQDVTEWKRAQERLSYLALHDPLTDLPNREHFVQRLREAIVEARRLERVVAVLFLDVDRFKFINDTLGHDTGDRLLHEVGRRLAGLLRSGDMVARYGGDEFTVLLANVARVDDISRVAQKLVASFSQPIDVAGRELFVTPSLGISVFPVDALTPENLIKHADSAMYHAKERGRNTFQFFTTDMNIRAARRLALETALRHAIERRELSLHYQPQVDLRSGRVIGAEALLRWRSAEFGDVSPGEFIVLAEETGMIIPIGEWVLRTACAQAQAWRNAGFEDVRVTVNLSSRQLQYADFTAQVRAALESGGLDGRHLDLELTESMLVRDVDATVAAFNELGALGVAFAVDDFGTGYSSLAYLKRFPIATLKIDRSFVQDAPQDTNDAGIATAIIALAHSLGIRVIAEGVETVEQLEFLRERGCDAMQGFFFSRAVPYEDFVRLLREGRCLPPDSSAPQAQPLTPRLVSSRPVPARR